MTENRRIALNVVASYARALFGLVCAFLTSRWVLLSLGEVDYGLNGVVGSLLAFVTFLNGVLAASNCRFYAYSVGELRSSEDKSAAIEECRRWFGVSLLVHLVLPSVLLAIGYPVGLWAIRNWLAIPVDRVADCVTVFRISCVGCFIGMVAVPFSAMYTAKQKIAELTVYSLVSTLFLVGFSWYMVTHPGVWLVRFSFWMCVVGLGPPLFILVHAAVSFPECRIRLSYLFDGPRLRRLLAYSCWSFWGYLTVLLRIQGLMVLVNKAFGAGANASVSLARNVNDRANMLSGAIKGAFAPAIVQACGAGDRRRMHQLVRRMCKFALLTTLMVAIPLVLEMSEVLRIWLKEPPRYLAPLAVCMVAEYVAGVATCGYDTAVYATGRIRRYQLVTGSLALMTLPVACVVAWCGGGICAVCWAAAGMTALFSIVRVCMASRIVGMRVWEWLSRLVIPSGAVGTATFAVAWLPQALGMAPGLVRVVTTMCLAECVFLPLAWFFSLDRDEHAVVSAKLGRLLKGGA